MKRLHDLVWPIAKAPEVVGSEPCSTCCYRDSCDLLLDYHWINKDFVFLDCMIRIRAVLNLIII